MRVYDISVYEAALLLEVLKVCPVERHFVPPIVKDVEEIKDKLQAIVDTARLS